MTLEIRMPDLAPGGAGATLVKWLVGVGSRIEVGDVVAEVESDKAVVELEAESGGVVDRIVVAEGTSDVVPDQVLAVLADSQPVSDRARDDARGLLGAAPSTATGERSARSSLELSPPASPATQGHAGELESAEFPAPRRARESSPANASALARHMSHQAGMQVRDIAGSGPGGRVLARDVLAALGSTESNGGESPVASIAPEAGAMHHDMGFAARAPGGETPRARAQFAPHELVTMDSVRRTVAHRLSKSKREAPHYYMSKACDVEALLELRAVLNRDLGPGRALSLNDLLIKIVAETLRRKPELNAAWDESGIRRFSTVDLSVAVAGSRGLVTPVIRGAERKSLARIAAELRDLVSRAKAGALSLEELAGGTFTVSNLGMHGVASFAAIINPPQAAILAIGAAEPTPVVVDGDVRSRHRMTCTLSVDHRVADGVAGAEFLAELHRLLEDPRRLVL